ncbi:MAG: hypothetical protein E2O76_17175 [Caldithrix sp.]|nr:MAG: hypothetical protein E2O76_17175 [Caldithrix sp.]
MSGNVYKWCLTKWCENYQAVEDNTTTGEDLRVVRGGSYPTIITSCAARTATGTIQTS